jgi:hypothetical protein
LPVRAFSKQLAERREEGERNPNDGGNANAGEALQPRNDQLPFKAIQNVGASARRTAPLAIALRPANTRLMELILREQRRKLTRKIKEASHPKASGDKANDIEHLSDRVLRE